MSVWFALFVALGTAGVSYVFALVSARGAWRWGAVDLPRGGRKIHTQPTPLLGGVGIAMAILMFMAVLQLTPLRNMMSGLRPGQLIGYAIGILFLLIGGMIDDRYPLPARVQIIFPVLAALAVIIGGTGITQVTQPTGHGAFSLVWWKFGHISLPSDLLTFIWLLVATYAMKILDGLDGLVTGLVVIGSGLVAGLSASVAFFQPAVLLLSAVVTGSFAGFLPRNIHPAKQFLGEVGSTVAGFSLGVLAILSSAKIAIALAALAIPITDVGLVILGRVKRGVPWFHGDATHLHHRLVQAGVPQQVAVLLYWGVALVAGIAALSLQTRGKIFLIGLLCALAAIASYIAGLKARRE